MFNFTYEDDIKIKSKHVAGISRTFHLSIETLSRPPQSRETIPLNNFTPVHRLQHAKDVVYILRIRILDTTTVQYIVQ
jgi:hypothetical protein